jgi:hypothetical protein
MPRNRQSSVKDRLTARAKARVPYSSKMKEMLGISQPGLMMESSTLKTPKMMLSTSTTATSCGGLVTKGLAALKRMLSF